MSKEIDNFVDEFIAELENSRIEREENIKNFVEVFNKKVPANYKFELETFDNYVWKLTTTPVGQFEDVKFIH